MWVGAVHCADDRRAGCWPEWRATSSARRIGSILPPVSTATRRPSGSSSAWNISAASDTAADGSSTRRSSRAATDESALDLLLLNRHHGVQVAQQVGERDRRRRLAAQPVGDRSRGLISRPGSQPAGGQRVARVGGQRRLDADQAGLRPQRLDGRRNAGREAAQADRRQHDERLVGRHATLGELLHDLQADRSLAGDHAQVVGRRHELQPVAVGNLVRTCHALLVVRADEDDLGAICPHAGHLDRGRVVGHHHDRADAKDSRRACDRLGVVAARMSDDARPALLGRQLGERVVSAAELERASRLEALGFDESAVAEGQQTACAAPPHAACRPLRGCRRGSPGGCRRPLSPGYTARTGRPPLVPSVAVVGGPDRL